MMRDLRAIRVIPVIWLFCFGLVVGSTALAAPPVFESLGRISEGLSAPAAIDIDAAGTLWVADSRERSVFHYDIYGALLSEFATVPVSGRGLAVSADGSTVFVTTDAKVAILDGLTGAVLDWIDPAANPGDFEVPGTLDLDAAGNLYVAATVRKEVLVYDAAYVLQRIIGSLGTGAGQFYKIDSLALNAAGTELIVTDGSSQNGRVQFFNLQGDLLQTLSTLDDFGPLPLLTPRGVVEDDLGRLYFLEFMRSGIHILDAGTLLYESRFVDEGVEIGQLSSVSDLAYDPQTDRLFVSCDGGRIEVFGIDGGANPQPVNHAPGTPTALSPIGGSEVAAATLQLNWQNAVDPDDDPLTYEVQILQDAAVVWSEAGIAAGSGSTSYAVPEALNENQAYAWQVRASDGELSSSWTVQQPFFINRIEEPPNAPVLLSPAEGATVDGQDDLSWAPVVDPDPADTVEYLLEIAADSAFTMPVGQSLVAVATVRLDTFANYLDLQDDSPYWWRVSARDQHGQQSAPSPAASFHYDTTLLSVTSNVPQAAIYWGGNHLFYGRYIGETPLQLRDIPPVVTSMVVVRTGCRPLVVPLALAERNNLVFDLELKPAVTSSAYQLGRRQHSFRDATFASLDAMPFFADFDHDGEPELLVGDNAGVLRLFRGLSLDLNGRIRIGSQQQLPYSVPAAAAPCVVDWNNDDRLDLLVGSSDGTVQLLRNQAAGFPDGLAAPVPIQAAGTTLQVPPPSVPMVTDQDGDGQKDLLIADGEGRIWLARNTGTDETPTFGPLVSLDQLPSSVRGVALDWAADADPEQLVVGDGAVQVLEDLGNGTVTTDVPVVEKNRAAVSDLHAVFPFDNAQHGRLDLFLGFADGALVVASGEDGDWLPSVWTAVADLLTEIDVLMTGAPVEARRKLDALQEAVALQDRTASIERCAELAARNDLSVEAKARATQLNSFMAD